MNEARANIVRRLLDEVWTQADLSHLGDLMHDDVVVHMPASPEPLQGLSAYRQFIALYHGIFDQISFSIDDQFGEEDRIATRWRARLDDSADGDGVMGMSIHRFDDERIVESWDSWDMLSVVEGRTGPDLLERLTLTL